MSQNDPGRPRVSCSRETLPGGESDRPPVEGRAGAAASRLPRASALVSNARMKSAMRFWGMVSVVVALASSACSEERDPTATEYQGIVEFDERALSFEVPGKVQTVHVERGSSLVRYAVIARLDDTLERLNKASLEAEGRATNSELNLLYAGTRPEQIAQARAKLAAARSKLDFQLEDFRRRSELWAKDAIPASELDASRNLMQQAEADRDAATQALAELRRGPRSQEIEAGEARLDAVRACAAGRRWT